MSSYAYHIFHCYCMYHVCRNLFPKLNHYILCKMEIYGRTLLTDNTGWMMDMEDGRWKIEDGYLERKLYLAVLEMKGELPDIITALSLSLQLISTLTSTISHCPTH